jgi:hypothetical protein
MDTFSILARPRRVERTPAKANAHPMHIGGLVTPKGNTRHSSQNS